MILLDTNSLLWWIGKPDMLSKKATQVIQNAISKKELLVSSISIWEISLLIKKKRLNIAMDIPTYIEKIEMLPYIQFIPVDNKIAMKSVLLNAKLHQDPADRIIIASALIHGATLITSDKRILKYKGVKSIW